MGRVLNVLILSVGGLSPTNYFISFSPGHRQQKGIMGHGLVIQTFELAWKNNIMLLLDQTLSSLEKQWVLNQATQVGDDFHL
jgi:hypothetical protein